VISIKTVKEMRIEKGISPPQMAECLGIALSTYFDKEAGRRGFKPPEIIKICSLFNVRVENVKNFYSSNTRNEYA